MSVKRKDRKGRILRTGETQRKDGRYMYKYVGSDGKNKYVYSSRLTAGDPVLEGNKEELSLREKIAEIEKEEEQTKEVEEKKLRELGVDEETIQRLHTYDWAQFNKERQYLQRQVDWSPYVDWVSAQDLELPVEDTESLLDSIEDMELFSLLHTVDKLTLEILFMKMDGYSSKEIASAFGMDEYAVNMRIYRLRKKIKKYL